MICQVCGGSGTTLWAPLPPRLRDWFRQCRGLCEGSGITNETLLKITRTNQIDRYGARFPKTRTYFSDCVVYDERDWYEFTAVEA